MKRTICLIITFFCAILTSSCTVPTSCVAFGPGTQDYRYDVGNGYILVRSSAHEIRVVPKGGWQNDNVTIPPKVVEIAWNDTYVIAKQLGLKKANPDAPNSSYKIPDENKVNYWILNTIERQRYGPYTEDEFTEKLIEFELTDLILKDVGGCQGCQGEGVSGGRFSGVSGGRFS